MTQWYVSWHVPSVGIPEPLPPIHLVCVRLWTLDLILSPHQHPFLYIPTSSRFIHYYNKSSEQEDWRVEWEHIGNVVLTQYTYFIHVPVRLCANLKSVDMTTLHGRLNLWDWYWNTRVLHVQGMISSFFLGIDWFDYWVLGLDYQSIW